MAIQSFADPVAERFFIDGHLGKGVGWSGISKIVRRKLDMIHYADRLEDLRSPPQNRLEALKGSHAGLHSIRVNDQWRIVFEWTSGGPRSVRVIDYHS